MGAGEKREKLLEGDYDVFIVNHDGLAIIEEKIPEDVDTVVFDELSVYRNGTSKRTKIAREVAARMKWVWGMTGSPIPNEPTDAWAQCRIVNPTRVPRYFGQFRDSVMQKVTQYKWVSKPNALDTVYNAMQPAVRFTLDDVVELPDVVHRVIDVEMGTKQKKLYEAMASKAHALVDSHEITAMNAGVVMNKLLQIACGYVYSTEKEVVELDNNERIAALVDIITSTNEKVLVFVPFKHTVAGISKALDKEGIEHDCITGEVNATARASTFNLFQNTSKYKAIVAHPATMSHGLTLTAASTVVWFAPILSLETWEQANARIRRIGQKAKQQIIMLQSTPIERKIYKGLEKKQNVQDRLLEMFAEAV
jgi:SNF2 family DNA or RNA helicase